MKQRDGFFCTGCGAHALNLLVEDVMKLPFVGDIVLDANTLAVLSVLIQTRMSA